MANYKKPEDRASETVTFRLTLKERQLLLGLAELEKKSLTDLMRSLLYKHAEAVGLDNMPVVQKPSQPAIAKRARAGAPIPGETVRTPPVSSPVDLYRYPMGPHAYGYGIEAPQIALTFGDLVAQFRVSFSGRAEGTKKELEETIRFLCDPNRAEPLLPFEMPLTDLTSTKLKQVRDAMMKMEIRVAKKNLHLTYLRMMLHWAVKQETIDLKLNPAVDLKPFTISEVPDAWPGRPFSAR